MGRKAVAVQCSVADFEACGQMITDMLAAFGHIDILVNNAGITKDNLMIKMTEEDFDAVIDTNLKGTFNTIKHMYRPMIKQRAGRIVNLSSVTGVLGNAGQANYAASKAGVIGLTKSMAESWPAGNITVNAVAPGFIDTDMTQAMTDAAKEATLAQIPLKRVGMPGILRRRWRFWQATGRPILPGRSFPWTAAWRCKAITRIMRKAG